MMDGSVQTGTILLIPRMRGGLADDYVIGVAEKVTDAQIRLKIHPRQPAGWFPVFVNRPADVIPIREDQVDLALALIGVYTGSVAAADAAHRDLRRGLGLSLRETLQGQEVGNG